MSEAKLLTETGDTIEIVHVDDEPDFADLTATFLEREDDQFTVETATSVDDGLETINDCPPDCIVSDYNMPGMDGLEFLQAVREEYTTVFENAQNALLLVDVEDDGFYYQQCNPRAVELIGRDRREIVGESPPVALGRENGRKVVGAYPRCIHQRESVAYTVTLDLPVGQVVRDCEVTPVSSDGEIGKLVVEFRDVTDQRERQRDLQKVETLERVNPAYEDATGVSASEIRGQTPQQLLGEEQGTAVEARYRECVERREPLQYTEQLQFGSDPSYWETRIAPVVVEDTVEYIAGSTRNVTEQRERQQELQEERRFITQAFDTLDDLF